MMRNCIILHGCPEEGERLLPATKRSYDKQWIPWVKKELQRKGVEAVTPLMPNAFEPNYGAFAQQF